MSAYPEICSLDDADIVPSRSVRHGSESILHNVWRLQFCRFTTVPTSLFKDNDLPQTRHHPSARLGTIEIATPCTHLSLAGLILGPDGLLILRLNVVGGADCDAVSLDWRQGEARGVSRDSCSCIN